MGSTIVAIETSTDACSVAVRHRDRIECEHEVAPRQHNRRVLGMIERALARAGAGRSDIDAIAFGCGPGSFTGTRIAASVAQGLGLALNRPVLRVETPDILAHTAWRCADGARGVLTAMTSRADEVYVAGYRVDRERLARVIEPCVLGVATLPPQLPVAEHWVVAGDRAPDVCRLAWVQALGLESVPGAAFPDARDLLTLAQGELDAGRGLPAEAALPVYLQGAAPWKKSAPKTGR